MANDVNRADVTVTLRDVHGQPITDEVEITFYNQKVHSLSKRFVVKFKGREEKLPGVAAFPTGNSEVFIKPAKYRCQGQSPRMVLQVLQPAQTAREAFAYLA